MTDEAQSAFVLMWAGVCLATIGMYLGLQVVPPGNPFWQVLAFSAPGVLAAAVGGIAVLVETFRRD